MEVTELSQDGLKREFKVVVDAIEVANKIAARLAEVGREASLPGFRPGKVPLPVLRKRFGANVMGEVVQRAVNDSSAQAISDRGLRPALPPNVTVTSFEEGKNLEFTLAFEQLPEIKPFDFKALELSRVKVQIADADIDKALERLADQRGKQKAEKVERAAVMGDIAIIDFTGRLDGVEFDGGKATDFRLELGSNQFVDQFEAQLVGAKAGESRVVIVKFPEDYGSEQLKGKTAQFEVAIKDVLAPVKVVLDEAAAKEMGFDDLAGLRKALSDQLAREYNELARVRTKRLLFDKLTAGADFALPGGMVDMELGAIVGNIEQERKQGVADQDVAGKSTDALRSEYRPIAERRVRLGLLLSEIGRINNVQVSQDEINRAVATQARRYPGQERNVVEHFRNNPEAIAQLRGPIFEEKVIDFILEMAKTSEQAMTVEELMKPMDGDDAKS